jgi:hypothetical protein
MLKVVRVEICQLRITLLLYLLVAKLPMKMLNESYSSVSILFTINFFKNPTNGSNWPSLVAVLTDVKIQQRQKESTGRPPTLVSIVATIKPFAISFAH